MVYGCSVVTSWRVSVLPQELQKHQEYRLVHMPEVDILRTVQNVTPAIPPCPKRRKMCGVRHPVRCYSRLYLLKRSGGNRPALEQ
jgi:hypothetical protein